MEAKRLLFPLMEQNDILMLRFTEAPYGGRIVGESIWESSRKRVYINFVLAHTFYLIMKVPLFAVLSHHHTLIPKMMLHTEATFTSKSYYEAHKSYKNKISTVPLHVC